ncbi:TPA: ParB N-terminal domain-containing protein [Salmonella enterica]|uniref:Chromosome partitioning protein ParB n=2 Tax=Enterobacteriaceae TaxID=543 RepID=A0A722BPC7_SALER|nr:MULTISPECIES: ParB N-terminal domain-containing protein [Enterobacteriaceae]EAW1246528.1 chromosome partitioning protein ParB [Salmonella enterica subsp. enterica]EBW7654839.1 chromosome partitioning protein ParB [Salmonella enterica subsp. enterica serovar Corvallis]ECD4258148.1 chromosome partitioning protein ParB [Salmonella enterica subsp. enterica serovar Stanley]ECF0418309.1 chromosome partitioning protein ParB [Salmonella enterica subsp. enterica serovar Indiana]ECZ8872128.1 chromoso
MPLTVLEPFKTQMISPDELILDAKNPRLYNGKSFNDNADPHELVKALSDTADLEELIKSISENGYMSIEPLIVMKKGAKYVVLEGNRRLAAIKLLTEPGLAQKCRVVVPKNLDARVIDSLKEVAVYLVNDESEARSFIGFKHVNGPHKWDSFAKAQFAYKWFVSERANGLTIDDITKKLGDSNNTVRSIVSAMFVLEQAKNQQVYDIHADRMSPKFSFSHLYTALNRSEYKDFLGLERDWNVTLKDNPVPSQNIDKLKDVLTGLYGYKKDKRASLISSQNPDLKYFGEVLANEASYEAFKSGVESLSELYKQAGDPLQHIKDAFLEINKQLDTISSVLDRTDSLDDTTKNYIEQFKKKVLKVQFQLQSIEE